MTVHEIALHAAVLGWGAMTGAMIYEHLCVIPVWARRPPESLAMWRGEHRLRAERFWMSIHPVLILLIAIALVAGWSAPGRDPLLYAAGAYALVIATTAVYYVPELMRLTRDPDAPIPAPEWRARARRWEVLSLVRGAVILAGAIPLLEALART